MANEPNDHDHDAREREDDIDPELQEQFDELLNVGIEVAQQLLAEKGGFVPFGVALTTEGESQVLMLEDDEQDSVEGEEVLEALVGELVDNRADLAGAALVSDVLLDDDQDAIRVDLEHADLSTEPMVVALQYSHTGDGQEYGELIGSVGERRIWA